MAESKSEPRPGERVPFPPAWIDRLILRIDGLPGPAWLFYVLGTLVIMLLVSVGLWIDGSVPPGTVGTLLGQLVFPLLTFYFLVLYHSLTRVASRSLRNFRPLLDMDDAGIARIEYELGSLPRPLGWLSIVLALVFLPRFYLDTNLVFGGIVPRTVLPYIISVPFATFVGATFMCFVLRSLRQLRLVHRLHARATNISLLHLAPTHAFSVLTASEGIAVLLFVFLEYLYDPTPLGSGWIVGYLATALLAVGIFVVPLFGMRQRIVREKERVLDSIGDLLQVAGTRLHEQVRSGGYNQLRDTRDAIEALTRERELYAGIPTWPWNPLTVRTFASALLLPIVLWLVTRLLERFL